MKLGMKGRHVNKIKAISHHTKWGKTESISSKVKKETSLFLSQLLFTIVLEFLARAMRHEEGIKGSQIISICR
jgi:hypothetical protein